MKITPESLQAMTEKLKKENDEFSKQVNESTEDDDVLEPSIVELFKDLGGDSIDPDGTNDDELNLSPVGDDEKETEEPEEKGDEEPKAEDDAEEDEDEDEVLDLSTKKDDEEAPVSAVDAIKGLEGVALDDKEVLDTEKEEEPEEEDKEDKEDEEQKDDKEEEKPEDKEDEDKEPADECNKAKSDAILVGEDEECKTVKVHVYDIEWDTSDEKHWDDDQPLDVDDDEDEHWDDDQIDDSEPMQDDMNARAKELGLPSEADLEVTVCPGDDLDEVIGDALFDEYEYCVNGFNFDVVEVDGEPANKVDESLLGDALKSIGTGIKGLVKLAGKGALVLIAGLGGSFLFGLPGLLIAVMIAFGLMGGANESEQVNEGIIKGMKDRLKVIGALKKMDPKEREALNKQAKSGTEGAKKVADMLTAKVAKDDAKPVDDKSAEPVDDTVEVKEDYEDDYEEDDYEICNNCGAEIDPCDAYYVADNEVYCSIKCLKAMGYSLKDVLDEGKTHKHDRAEGRRGRPHEEPKKLTQRDLIDIDDEDEEDEDYVELQYDKVAEDGTDDGIDLNTLTADDLEKIEGMDDDAREKFLNMDPDTQSKLLGKEANESVNVTTAEEIHKFVKESNTYKKSRTLREASRKFEKLVKESPTKANYIAMRLNRDFSKKPVTEKRFCAAFVKYL